MCEYAPGESVAGPGDQEKPSVSWLCEMRAETVTRPAQAWERCCPGSPGQGVACWRHGADPWSEAVSGGGSEDEGGAQREEEVKSAWPHGRIGGGVIHAPVAGRVQQRGTGEDKLVQGLPKNIHREKSCPHDVSCGAGVGYWDQGALVV
ncbi:hypothetical protein NDU88_001999 [Pleurodeles waltl]|uniref:Uncharacterized protein n=1 Tax=Pleurodeles waltl TaxID=8319 RepID=A0AAV7UUB1_PLEWA|nr:hypothetical protein NDU88_001999 [Pleurodeles waltl]